MKRFSAWIVFVFFVLIVTIGLSPNADSQSAWPHGCQEGSLPSGDPKYPADQLIVICIPSNWNNQLVMYAHGYVPVQEPLALPLDELTLPDGSFVPNFFLSQGFAFATTSFHKNGVAIEQGAADLNRLLEYFISVTPQGSLQKVYITGASEGGLTALMLLERFPTQYHGGLALCAPVAGSSDFLQNAYDFRVVFDYFFPNVFTFPPNQPGEQRFGAVNVPESAYLFWESDYLPRIIIALLSNPAATIQLYKVTRTPLDPADPTSVVRTALIFLFYSLFGTNDQIATVGGVAYDNRSTTYSGSTNDAALNAGVERVAPDETAQAYARQFYQPDGNLQRHFVTLHTTLDPLVRFEHEIKYNSLVAQQGKLGFLSVLPVPRYGHCNFTADEIIEAFTLMVRNAGVRIVN